MPKHTILHLVRDLQDHLDKQLSILENKYGIKKEYDSADVRFQ